MKSSVTVESPCVPQTTRYLLDSMKNPIELKAEVLKYISKVQFLMHSFALLIVFVTLI